MASKSYLVTGGAGFLGAALVRHLLDVGQKVAVLDDFSRGAPRRLEPLRGRLELLEGDIRDRDVVRRATEDVDAVWHLASVNGTEHFYAMPDVVLDVAVRGMINVIDACTENDVAELFLASSSEVYQTPPSVPTDEAAPLSIPDPLNPRFSYAAGKITSEILALNYGRKRFERVVVFRPHNVYGPDMGSEHVISQFAVRAAALIREHKTGVIPFSIQGDGSETRAFLHVDDFIDGLEILRNRGEHLGIYHIGCPEEVSIRRVAELVFEHLDRDFRIVAGELRTGSPERRCPDISKMRSLGFEPRVSLADGLPGVLRWYGSEAGG